MPKNKNTITIIGVLISITILLFGNNILGRLFSKKLDDKPRVTSDKVEKEVLLNALDNRVTIVPTSDENSNTSYIASEDLDSLNQVYIEGIVEELLSKSYSAKLEELILSKEFEKALNVLKISKTRTTQSSLLKLIDNQKRSILLMLEKDFDNVWFRFPSKLILTERNGKKGLYSRDGEEVSEPIYDEIDPNNFYPLLLTVKNGKYGFLDSMGIEIIPTILTIVEPDYFEPLVLIEENEKYGFISSYGEKIFEPQFSRVKERYRDLIIVKKNDKWGLIHTFGHEVTKMKFDTIGTFSEEGIALVRIGSENFFINTRGNRIKSPAFQ